MKKLFILLFPLFIFSQDNNYSMKFDVNENYLEVDASQFEDNNGFTYMAWVKLINVTDENECNIYSNYSGSGTKIFGFGAHKNESIGNQNNTSSARLFCDFRINGEFRYVSCPPGLGQIAEGPLEDYQHVAVTFDGFTLKFHLNGINIFSTETTTSLGGNEQEYEGNGSNSTEIPLSGEYSFGETNLSIGDSPQGGTEWDGWIDEAMVFNYALTEEQIVTFKDCSPSEGEIGLMGYWNFEEGSNEQVVLDLSGNDNHAIIIGYPNYSVVVPEQGCSQESEETDTEIVIDVDCDGEPSLNDAQMIVNILLEEWGELGVQDLTDENEDGYPDEFLDLYPCALQNITQSNTETPVLENNYPIEYPQGYSEETIVHDLEVDYTVEEGKTLYVTGVYTSTGGGVGIEGEEIGVSPTILIYDNNSIQNTPYIIGPGQTLSASSSSGFTSFNGYLVDYNPNIEPITHLLSVSTYDLSDPYTVEEGKTLYVTGFYTSTGGGVGVKGEGIGVTPILIYGNNNIQNKPYIIGSGQTLSAWNLNGITSFNGYLVDDNPNIEPITHLLGVSTYNLSDPYTVEEGKTLYVTNFYTSTGSGIGIDAILSYSDNINLGICIIGPGQTLSAWNLNGITSFNGYLVDEQ